MKSIVHALLLALIALAFHAVPASDSVRAASPPGAPVEVHLFWTPTCPHCASVRRFLERRAPEIPGVRLRSYDLSAGEVNEAAFIAIARHFQIDPPAVPVVVVGEYVFVGYGDDETTGAEIEQRIRACVAAACRNIAADVIAQAKEGGATTGPASSVVRPELPETVRVPILGEVATRELSLPALTVLLAAIDGFNPCAMWVLVFLIGLLIGLRDPIRMWSYGAAFLFASGAVYFVIMAAWLNLFLMLGAIAWIRAAVGIFAVAAGAYYLREYIRNPEAACPIGTPGEKERTMERMRRIVGERSFLTAIAGIMALAVAVNMIEMLCSAGIPAVYTQVLSLNPLGTAAYYGYLALYVLVFMLDDAVIFTTAMLTLQATGLTTAYVRISHLIGGVVLIGIGLLLVLRPGWLSLA